MSISLALQKTIISRLKADAAIMAIAKTVCLVGNESTNYPFITLGPAFETPNDLLSVEKSDWRVQIDVWGNKPKNSDDIHKLNDLIKTSFHRMHNEISLDVGSIYLIELINKQILPDPKGWHGVVEFNFKINGE